MSLFVCEGVADGESEPEAVCVKLGVGVAEGDSDDVTDAVAMLTVEDGVSVAVGVDVATLSVDDGVPVGVVDTVAILTVLDGLDDWLGLLVPDRVGEGVYVPDEVCVTDTPDVGETEGLAVAVGVGGMQAVMRTLPPYPDAPAVALTAGHVVDEITLESARFA